MIVGELQFLRKVLNEGLESQASRRKVHGWKEAPFGDQVRFRHYQNLTMQDAQSYVGARMWREMVGIYRDWVSRDQYGSPFVDDADLVAMTVPSLRLLVSSLFQKGEEPAGDGRRMPKRIRLEMTVAELLELPFLARTANQFDCTVETVAQKLLARAYIPNLLREGRARLAISERLDSTANLAELSRLTAICSSEDVAAAMGAELMQQLREVTGSRRLWSFYRREGKGVCSESVPNWSHIPVEGRSTERPSTWQVSFNGSTLMLRVQPLLGSGSWDAFDARATLHNEKTPAIADVAVWATVYEHSRERNGEGYRPQELVASALERGPDEPRRFEALFAAFPEVPDRLDYESICTLRSWERRAGATPSTGALCARLFVSQLLLKFPKLGVLTLDALPQQFVNSLSDDPSEVLVARLEAAERLTSYVESLELDHYFGEGLVAILGPRVPR